MEHYKECCQEVLHSAEKLLNRYIKKRRRPGSSPAGRILRPCLTVLPGVEAFLSPENRCIFQKLSQVLISRQRLLAQRRIPLCWELHRLNRRCRALMGALPDVPDQWDSPSVLVGTLRHPGQLDISLKYGFYHIPSRLVPLDRLPIHYVAIYQSRAMFPDCCGVEFYGRVKSCTLVPRWKIHEIHSPSDELYYRLEVECWKRLDVPVQVLEIPFTRLFTNLFLLQNSTETPEFLLKTPAHYLFYQALHLATTLEDGVVFRHQGGTVRLKNGLFEVHRHGRRVAAFVAEDFHQTPSDIFLQLMAALERNP